MASNASTSILSLVPGLAIDQQMSSLFPSLSTVMQLYSAHYSYTGKLIWETIVL